MRARRRVRGKSGLGLTFLHLHSDVGLYVVIMSHGLKLLLPDAFALSFFTPASKVRVFDWVVPLLFFVLLAALPLCGAQLLLKHPQIRLRFDLGRFLSRRMVHALGLVGRCCGLPKSAAQGQSFANPLLPRLF